MLIAMSVWDTESNKRTEFTYKTLASLCNTVDFTRHRLIVSDNGSCSATQEVYSTWQRRFPFTILNNGKNIGTARAINRAWNLRDPHENAVKMDNDVVIHQSGWADLMEEVFKRDPSIGICGLKRKDLDECPWSTIPWYVSTLRMLPHEKGERWIIVEQVEHVMGTCQAYNHLLLDKIGYLDQMEGVYGFDDSLSAVRSKLAGFTNVFLPDVEIDHIDPGATQFTQWKLGYAGQMMEKFNIRRHEYISGTRPLYYRDEYET